MKLYIKSSSDIIEIENYRLIRDGHSKLYTVQKMQNEDEISKDYKVLEEDVSYDEGLAIINKDKDQETQRYSTYEKYLDNRHKYVVEFEFLTGNDQKYDDTFIHYTTANSEKQAINNAKHHLKKKYKNAKVLEDTILVEVIL